LPNKQEWRLTTLEGVIERGLQTFVEVGNALDEISRDGLYKATHPTFEAYCRERWGHGRKYVDRLIAAQTVRENLTPTGVITPIAERTLRPLTALEPDEQRTAWAEAVDRSEGNANT